MKLAHILSLSLVGAIFFSGSAHAQSTVPTAEWPFAITSGGGNSIGSSGASPEPNVGYARIQTNGGGTPAGLAIFGFRQNGVLVTEAGVPPSALLYSGRIHAEAGGPVKTGLAIANPGDVTATISFHFTDSPGMRSGDGFFLLPARQKIAAFLTEAPFNGSSNFRGSFTFSSSAPVASIAFRGFTNTRGEFLITTLPVVDVDATVKTQPILFPDFADGGGWATQVVLTNPTNTTLSGTLQFLNQSGGPADIVVDGQATSSFSYSIPPETSATLQTGGSSPATISGSILATPASGTPAPTGLVILSFTKGGVRVTEAGNSNAQASTAFRMYAEVSGSYATPGPISSAIAVANPSLNATMVTVELLDLDGSFTGLSGTLQVPSHGQQTRFLNEIPGLTSLPTPFQGLARIMSTEPVAIMGIRGRYNERRDFLVTTTPPVDEANPGSSEPLYFPHIVDSGGYSMQFIVFGRTPGQSLSGSVQIFSGLGDAMDIRLAGNPSLAYAELTAGPHPLVARYDVTSTKDGEVIVEFGTSTNYERRTSSYSISSGETERILVAGMKPATQYHMRAKLLVDGVVQWTDSDRVFTTGQVGPIPLPKLIVTRDNAPFVRENPGVELIAFNPPVPKSTLEAFVTDRDGNLLWFYNAPVLPQFLKLMPNGHMLVALAQDRLKPKTIREIDLEGTTIREMTSQALQQKLKQFAPSVNLTVFSHDFIPMPNGHLIVLAEDSRRITFAGPFGAPTIRTVIGDVVVDLDPDWNPVWVWSAFDHLDTNRFLMGLPDWTHGNAVVYNPADGNLLLSMRHQSWILNIDYQDGKGSGDVLWRLGKDGDFALAGGDPSQWFYAQHFPNIISTRDSVMTLAVFDNGNMRFNPDGVATCGNSPYPKCYSRATIFEVDQANKTARLLWDAKQDVFSSFAGAINSLPNGNIEFEMADGIPGGVDGSRIREVTTTGPARVLWQMDILGGSSYRSYRIPSLYPDITWP